jgi:integrase
VKKRRPPPPPPPQPEKLPTGIRRKPNKDGSVSYLAYAYEGGAQISLGARDSVDAAVALRLAYYQVKANEGLPTPEDLGILTLRQLGALYFDQFGQKWDKRRWSARIEGMAEFIDWPITQIGQEHVRRWIAKMAATPIASGKNAGEKPTRGTLHSAIVLLRTVFAWACMPDQGYLTINPCPAHEVTIKSSTRERPKSRRNVFDYLREDEARLLNEPKIEIPLAQLTKFRVLMWAGPRPIDAWRLSWPDIDWSTDIVKFGSSKTSHDQITEYFVHMLPQLAAGLREWWLACGRPKRGLVFPSGSFDEKGNELPYTSGYDAGWQDKSERRQWVYYVDNTEDGSLSADSTRPKRATRTGAQAKELRRLHGERKKSVGELKVTPGWRSKLGITRDVPLYALRHTCACNLLLGTDYFVGGRTWTREEVQSQLGHKDSSATEFYLRALGLASRKAVVESREALKKKRSER